MLKRLKLKFMVIAILMVAIIGFSFFNEAMGQDEICPGVPFTTGWIRLGIPAFEATFTAGLLGTVESFSGANIGGLDWLFTDSIVTNRFASVLNTNLTGSQLVSWWTQANGRDTSIQVTNTNPTVTGAVNLHVQILGPDCSELLDFCDSLTPNDTHVYDLGDGKLVTNTGQSIGTSLLQRTGTNEGIIVFTPVNSCPDPNAAISFNFLQGFERITQSGIDEYGTNVYARLANSGACPSPTPGAPTVLTGTVGCAFAIVAPNFLRGNFSILRTDTAAAADLVFMSLIDSYGSPPSFTYSALPGAAIFAPQIFNDVELTQSCPRQTVCFARFGIDDPLPVSENFSPVSPTPSPTAIPTATPSTCFRNIDCPDSQVCIGAKQGKCDNTSTACFTSDTCSTGQTCNGAVAGTCGVPTPTPTRRPGGGGGGGCSIGGPVEIGTAMANVLVPLVPAFAIGYRVLRRRAKKNQK